MPAPRSCRDRSFVSPVRSPAVGIPRMQRLSIARSLRLALLGLTVVLAVVAGLGIDSLYASRQAYENALAQSSSLATASAGLLSDAVLERELAGARGSQAGRARRQLGAAYRSSVSSAEQLARGDATSVRLLGEQMAAQGAAITLASAGPRRMPGSVRALGRARSAASALQDRQQARQREARAHARSRSRRALIVVALAGLLALACALAVVSG